MSHGEYTNLSEVTAALDRLNDKIDSQNREYDQRRKEDDKRTLAATKAREELLKRVDAHGLRTTKLESRFEAFFGPEGAFQSVLHRGISQGKKIDKLSWLMGIGVGIVATLEFILLLKK